MPIEEQTEYVMTRSNLRNVSSRIVKCTGELEWKLAYSHPATLASHC